MPDENPEGSRIEIEPKDSVAFWQKEVHYYEGRAGEQGGSANRLVTVAGGAVAALGVVAAVSSKPEQNPYLLLIPVVILLIWAAVLRLLHEMSILRAYREHAERQLTKLLQKDSSGDLAMYRPWSGIGSEYDMPKVITWTFMLLAVALSLAGTAGVIILVNDHLAPWASIVSWVGFLAAVSALAYTYLSNGRHASGVRRQLRAKN